MQVSDTSSVSRDVASRYPRLLKSLALNRSSPEHCIMYKEGCMSDFNVSSECRAIGFAECGGGGEGGREEGRTGRGKGSGGRGDGEGGWEEMWEGRGEIRLRRKGRERFQDKKG